MNKNEVKNIIKEELSFDCKSAKSEDFCSDYGASDAAYICDAFSEFADGQTSIYYSDILDYMRGNIEEVCEAIDEFGWDGCGKDLYKAAQIAEYIHIERELEEDITAIICTLAVEYLTNTIYNDYNGTEDELRDACAQIYAKLELIDNNDRLDTIADTCDEWVKEYLTMEAE